MKIIKKAEKWELHHKILAFSIIITATILLTRLAVFVHDPNPIIFNFEIHHFDYGLFLLVVTCLLLLFGKKNYPVYMFVAAVALGLIVDDLWFIRGNVYISPGLNETAVYNATFLSALVIAKVVIFAVLLINHFNKRKKK